VSPTAESEGDKEMKSLLRRHLVLLMLGVTAAAFTVNVQAPAFAKDGHSGNSGSGSSGSSGGDDGDSGSGSGDSDSGGNSGSGSGDSDGDDNSGSNGDSDDNDSNDDSNNRSASNDDRRDDNRNGGGRNRADRPRIEISVDAATRAGLLNGSLVAVDNLGRALEVEVEDRNGQGVLEAKPHGGDAKRNPGPITSFDIVPAAQAPVHQ
jgi:hypothetical protein